MSLKMAGQVITEGIETIILEHLWVNAAGFPLVKSYTTGERSEELGYAWSLQYHGIENTASVHQLWPREIEEYLNLVIADLQSTSVLGPMGTKVFNLNIEAPSNHSDILSASKLWGRPGVRLTNSLRVFSRS